MTITIKNKIRLYPFTILITSFFGSIFSPVYAFEKPFTQEVLVTAYYSPLPNQCCYFRGSYEEEITFNGNGTNGADGTRVYEGMLAAPASYSFGTRIALPSLGVGTVHDRGGRIIEWESQNIHRIDVWMGSGEEGLKRALAWGARRMTATVYPEGTDAPAQNLSFASVQTNEKILAGLAKGDPHLLMTQAKFGDKNYSVRILQTTLRDLGYFDHSVTGEFGLVTQEALKRFLNAYNLPGDGKSIGPIVSATLTVAQSMKEKTDSQPMTIGLVKGVNSPDVSDLKRRLRFLGFYKGRTDSSFDQQLEDSVKKFQSSRGVIQSHTSAGAGRVGPATKRELALAWKEKMVSLEVQKTLVRSKVETLVTTKHLPKKTLTKGERGKDVLLLQKSLVTLGYLPSKDVTGLFGDRTYTALKNYQLQQKIISSDGGHGTGVVGTATRSALKKSLTENLLKKVRAAEMGV